jgi:hypothetical protein
LADGDPGARLVLGRATGLDTEREDLTGRIEDAEAVAAEWEDVDDSGLSPAVDLLRALGRADTAEALNATMARVVTGIYAGLRDGRLRAEFELRADGPSSIEQTRPLFRHATVTNLEADRFTFSETLRQTFV